MEYLIRRATALKQQQAAALALTSGSYSTVTTIGAGSSPRKQGGGRSRKSGGVGPGNVLARSAEQALAAGPAGTGPVVTLEHLLTAMKETGAVRKLQEEGPAKGGEGVGPRLQGRLGLCARYPEAFVPSRLPHPAPNPHALLTLCAHS